MATLVAIIKILMSLFSFNNFLLNIIISILLFCLPRMQLTLTTSLQLVCVCKQVIKQPLLLSGVVDE